MQLNSPSEASLTHRPSLSDSWPALVIPAYQPTDKLIELVQTLLEQPYCAIYVVNDGSRADLHPIFERLAQLDRVRVLTHAVNLGKGCALKTALNYVLLDFPDGIGAVTLDADGQHLPEDVARVAAALREKPEDLHLGVRLFQGDVPFRSRFGNSLTRRVFQFLTGQNIRDTQTGLRGIPRSFLAPLLRLPTRGYEFELDMLIQASQAGLHIGEVVIQTVYENNNASSHFNPIFDSVRIYFVFIRFLASSVASLLLDNGLFVTLHLITGNVLSSLIGARMVSGTFNFLAVKSLVFKSKGSLWLEAGQYLLLVIFSMTASYFLIRVQTDVLHVPLYVAKLAAETVIFFFNFAAQRTFIFVRSSTSSSQ